MSIVCLDLQVIDKIVNIINKNKLSTLLHIHVHTLHKHFNDLIFPPPARTRSLLCSRMRNAMLEEKSAEKLFFA